MNTGTFNSLADAAAGFVVMLARIGCIVVFAPPFSARAVPMQVKMVFAVFLALAMQPVVRLPGVSLLEPFAYAMLLAGEMVYGTVLGIAATTVFWSVQMAGQIAGYQMGFGMVNALDMNLGAQVSLIDHALYVFAILVLLSMSGHHWLIEAIQRSYQVLPVGGGGIRGALAERLLRLGADSIAIAVRIAAPICITMLLINVVLGIVARTMPQINIFIVGFPLQIGLGLLTLGLVSGVFVNLLMQLFTRVPSFVEQTARAAGT